MHHPDQFNLHHAIAHYIDEINNGDLLRGEEYDELFDHLLSDTEALMEDGLSAREAFTLSTDRFGSTGLIRQEYERAKPFASLKSRIVTGMMLFFTVLLLIGLTEHLTILNFLIGDHFHWSARTGRIFDFGLKALLLGGFAAYFTYRLKNYPYFCRLELWLLPLLGGVLPYLLARLWPLVQGPSGLYTYQKDMLSGMLSNSKIMAPAGVLILIVVHYLRRYKDRDRRAVSRTGSRQSVVFMFFFYLLVIQAGIKIMSFVSFYGGQWMGLTETGISNFDLILKCLFVDGMAIFLFLKRKKPQMFGRRENWMLPLLAMILFPIVDYMYVILSIMDPMTRKFMRTFVTNSYMINAFALLLLLILTFVMVAQEQRRLTKGLG
ncbi:hypothetical protein [Flavilitoribacter nigricans]|uniref:Uncharacterized protein n=1 Tax=Flavilitoribacter nigricans (strain ATCC 23147 / DSM 23189 / NBRC 102662 / NCIMB 1420 / SS-2) TaxID=1122177 RepID=A0A2D0NCN3_FLAN2|nr:hypothetical protein [Flavilitoribacter nigricans]PHN05939.1 hypothetical protein CRP01_13245 [Flavilitoribacter nigricans DSM 23189 = NBRC 102662]